MKKNQYIIIVIVFIGLMPLHGQKKFIEVLVKDTIALKPLSYEFQVSSGMEFRYNFENPNGEKEYGEKLRASEEEITTQLKNWNYDFKSNQNPETHYDLGFTDKEGFMVVLKDSVAKEEFKTRMKVIGANFHLAEINYENEAPKDKEMYVRLLKKARDRAELIASLSSLKVGNIIEISESKSEVSLISGFIENFRYSRSSGGTSTSYSFNPGVFEKTLLVKFEVE